MGEKTTTEEDQFKATFTIPYTSGELKAVGLMDGREMESTVLKTAGQAFKIKLTADRTTILSNGQDLSFVSIEITDAEGNLLPNAENRLQFTIDGPGIIAGVDNANIKDTGTYVSNFRKAWKGKALAVIKSTRKKGDILFSVSSPGLPDATIKIKAEETTGITVHGQGIPPRIDIGDAPAPLFDDPIWHAACDPF